MKVSKIDNSLNFGWQPKVHGEITKLACRSLGKGNIDSKDIFKISASSAKQDLRSECINANNLLGTYKSMYQDALLSKNDVEFLSFLGKSLRCLQELLKPTEEKESFFQRINPFHTLKPSVKNDGQSKQFTEKYRKSDCEFSKNLVNLFYEAKSLSESAEKPLTTQERFNISVDVSRIFIEQMFTARHTKTP